MLRICCWKWENPNFVHRAKFAYGSEHVNRLKRMLMRNLTIPYEFCCITDNPEGIDKDVTIIPLWDDFINHKGQPLGRCYRRLKAFHKDMEKVIGKRFAWIDLDVVIVRNCDHVFGRGDEFIMWGDTARNTFYNGSMLMMNAGCRQEVLDRFDPNKSPAITAQQMIVGSDQAWISWILGGNERKWSINDGVYSFRIHFHKANRLELPNNACMVFFHGAHDPSMPAIQKAYPWVTQHWR